MGKRKMKGWRTIIRRGQKIPVIVRYKHGETLLSFGVDHDGNHVIDAPRNVEFVVPDRRPIGKKT